jgi:DNA-binding NarL/FixJ family response regulator
VFACSHAASLKAQHAEACVTAPKALVCIATPAVRDDIVHAAKEHIDLVSAQAGFDGASDRLDDDVQLVFADVTSLRAIARHARNGKPGASARVPAIILVLTDNELQDALGFLHLCHGLLFWEHDIERLSRLIVITLEGYSGVPPHLLADLTTDRVRTSLIDKLAPVEQRTLHLLAGALSNRAIARELGVPDPVAKSLVRSVLTKLRLKNRTEAAVLAARWFGNQPAEPALRPLTPAEPIAS